VRRHARAHAVAWRSPASCWSAPSRLKTSSNPRVPTCPVLDFQAPHWAADAQGSSRRSSLAWHGAEASSAVRVMSPPIQPALVLPAHGPPNREALRANAAANGRPMEAVGHSLSRLPANGGPAGFHHEDNTVSVYRPKPPRSVDPRKNSTNRAADAVSDRRAQTTAAVLGQMETLRRGIPRLEVGRQLIDRSLHVGHDLRPSNSR
jgi:hypothetical protein